MFVPKEAQSWGVWRSLGHQCLNLPRQEGKNQFLLQEVFRDYRWDTHCDVLFGLDMGTMAAHSVIPVCTPPPQPGRFPPCTFQDTEWWVPKFCTLAFKCHVSAEFGYLFVQLNHLLLRDNSQNDVMNKMASRQAKMCKIRRNNRSDIYSAIIRKWQLWYAATASVTPHNDANNPTDHVVLWYLKTWFPMQWQVCRYLVMWTRLSSRSHTYY